MRVVVACLLAATAFAQSPDRLKGKVAAMLKADQDNLPSSEGVLFVGGAEVEKWDVHHFFSQYRTINRGMAGSRIADAAAFADQLIVPLKPSTIVVWVSPDENAADFSKFIAKIHTSLPKTQLVLVALPPNPKVREIADQDKGIKSVDLESDDAGYDLMSPMVKLVIRKSEARYWRGYDPVSGQ
jgi:hypothetical protein